MPAVETITESWITRKTAVSSTGGVCSAQTAVAAAVGAEVLEHGGNAVDAAVAAGMAAGVVEPWMNGLGGGLYCQVYRAADRSVHTVDAGMVAAKRLDPETYALTGGYATDLFAWPKVVEDRNLVGYHAALVPTHVAGLAAARDAFGTMDWDELLAPAVRLAEEGLLADWPTTLFIAKYARDLARFPASAAVFLPDGLPPAMTDLAQDVRVRNPALAKTLRTLQDEGPRAFYQGPLAAAIAADLQAGGSMIDEADLKAVQARVVAPLRQSFRDVELILTPGLSGGPTTAHAMAALDRRPRATGAPGADDYLAFIDAFRDAFTERLSTYGDTGDAGDPNRQSCTTHLNVIDREGNAVSLTQTLLSGFGSKVVLPETGILMNNGMMWFDPEPGKPNSIRPGRRPLANMAPALVLKGGEPWLAIGASGGRKIMPAVAQIIWFMAEFGMDLETAFHTPRVDVSGAAKITADRTLAADIMAVLRDMRGVVPTPNIVSPDQFARPNAVEWDPGSRTAKGIATAHSPTDTAVAASAV